MPAPLVSSADHAGSTLNCLHCFHTGTPTVGPLPAALEPCHSIRPGSIACMPVEHALHGLGVGAGSRAEAAQQPNQTFGLWAVTYKVWQPRKNPCRSA
eukprot:353313-Chlamydomonas_euryale.AAC.5